MQQYIEDPLAELLLQGNLEPGTVLTVQPSADEAKLDFDTVVQAEGVAT